jgi:hypothetical protein
MNNYLDRSWEEWYQCLVRNWYTLTRDSECSSNEIKITFPQIKANCIFKLPWNGTYPLHLLANYFEGDIDLLLNGNEWLEDFFKEIILLGELPNWVNNFLVFLVAKRDLSKRQNNIISEKEEKPKNKETIIINGIVLCFFWDKENNSYIIDISSKILWEEENESTSFVIIHPKNTEEKIFLKIFSYAFKLAKEGKNAKKIFDMLEKIIRDVDLTSNTQEEVDFILWFTDDDFKPHAHFEYYSEGIDRHGYNKKFGEVNDIHFQIWWNSYRKAYDIYFPNLELDFEDPEKPTDTVIILPEGWEVAEKFFDIAVGLAKKWKSDVEIYNKLIFIEMLPDGTFPQTELSWFGLINDVFKKPYHKKKKLTTIKLLPAEAGRFS